MSVPVYTGFDIDCFNLDTSRSCIFSSAHPTLPPEHPLLEECAVGIDEAGRGPVLGPMVYGILACPLSKYDTLKDVGVKDSKALTEEERESQFSKLLTLTSQLGFATHILSPNTINGGMLKRDKYNLNAISHDTAIGLVQHLLSCGVNVAELYVDTVGPADKYEALLSSRFPNIRVRVSAKADSLFPVVSAASICAKVIRDRCLRRWLFKENALVDLLRSDLFGSGYPSDPSTRTFLDKALHPVFGFPQLVRFGWSTSRKLIEKNAFQVDWSDGEDDADEDMENEGTFERSKKRARTETDAEGKQNEKTKGRPVRLSQALASERASNRSILQFFGRGSAAPDAPPAHLKPPAALEPWADPRAADKFCLNNFSTFTPH